LFNYLLGCLFKLSYSSNENSEFKLNQEKSCFVHNHLPDLNLQSKIIEQTAPEFMIETIKEKKVTPKEMQEKLKEKFDKNYDYQTVLNAQQKIDSTLFGNPTEDAETLRKLILNLKAKFPDFLGEILEDKNTHELKSIFYATSVMKDLAGSFMDLVVIDTTFGTNRFWMKHWTLCGKDKQQSNNYICRRTRSSRNN